MDPMWVVVFVVLLLLASWECITNDSVNFIRFFDWLKGSRTSYFTTYGRLRCDGRAFRTANDRTGYVIDDSVIEINRGPFRRRSAIYGPAAKNWRIAKTSKGCNAQGGFGADWVNLIDRSSLPVERALHLVNRYPSLQAMLGRIAELEQQVGKLQDKLAWTESHRKTWLATLEAIRQEIESDRQRYRSQAAQKIRTRVEQVLEHAKSLDQVPDEDSVDAIKRLWIVRDGGTPPLRKFGGQVWGY